MDTVPTTTTTPSLHEDQRRLFDQVINGRANLFFTGSAGTGKSVLLRAIIAEYKRKYGKEKIYVTATTGLAATQIGGSTLHSFAGIGLGKEPVEELIQRVQSKAIARKRWNTCHALVLDEISMLDATLFEKLDRISRVIRNRPREPFGGIQLIATGDFFQLPPIGDTENGVEGRYAFEASCWNAIFPVAQGCQQSLTKIHRQQDPTFVNLLQQLRHGISTPEMIQTFGSDLAKRVTYANGLKATELFPTRIQVYAANNTRLNALTTPTVRYDTIDQSLASGKFHLEKLQRDCIASAVIELKVGAQVMLLKNLSDTLVNGSLGIVKEFITPSDPPTLPGGKRMHETNVEKVPLVEFSIYGPHGIDPDASVTVAVTRQKCDIEEGRITMASRTQIPLTLAYAVSIHKVTLDSVVVDRPSS